jgi:hypothetical protein
MASRSNDYIRRAIGLAKEMKQLADQGELSAEDSSCAVLFGVIRDCAYTIEGRAVTEQESHKALGVWDERGAGDAP